MLITISAVVSLGLGIALAGHLPPYLTLAALGCTAVCFWANQRDYEKLPRFSRAVVDMSAGACVFSPVVLLSLAAPGLLDVLPVQLAKALGFGMGLSIFYIVAFGLPTLLNWGTERTRG